MDAQIAAEDGEESEDTRGESVARSVEHQAAAVAGADRQWEPVTLENLPVEVLMHIFRLASEGDKDAKGRQSISSSHINRYTRDVALQTPGLWATLSNMQSNEQRTAFEARAGDAVGFTIIIKTGLSTVDLTDFLLSVIPLAHRWEYFVLLQEETKKLDADAERKLRLELLESGFSFPDITAKLDDINAKSNESKAANHQALKDMATHFQGLVLARLKSIDLHCAHRFTHNDANQEHRDVEARFFSGWMTPALTSFTGKDIIPLFNHEAASIKTCKVSFSGGRWEFAGLLVSIDGNRMPFLRHLELQINCDCRVSFTRKPYPSTTLPSVEEARFVIERCTDNEIIREIMSKMRFPSLSRLAIRLQGTVVLGDDSMLVASILSHSRTYPNLRSVSVLDELLHTDIAVFAPLSISLPQVHHLTVDAHQTCNNAKTVIWRLGRLRSLRVITLIGSTVENFETYSDILLQMHTQRIFQHFQKIEFSVSGTLPFDALNPSIQKVRHLAVEVVVVEYIQLL